MEKQNFTATRKLLLALACAALLAVPTISARAQSGGILDVLEQARQAQAQQLEGSWVVTVTPAVPPGVPQPQSFRTYLTNSRGGASIGSDRTRPFGSPQHGTWAHTGGNEFAATQIQDLFDVMGNFQGTLTVRQKITLTGNDQFVGVATAETRDAAGNVTTMRCATTRGERIKIEPLAPQCQSITPPQ
ncbi:MAG: hypothetical protein M3X11_08055 [Acidobacteriota bacterium]|nr:hypothetical protein [Acidobacteriota bacterium]